MPSPVTRVLCVGRHKNCLRVCSIDAIAGGCTIQTKQFRSYVFRPPSGASCRPTQHSRKARRATGLGSRLPPTLISAPGHRPGQPSGASRLSAPAMGAIVRAIPAAWSSASPAPSSSPPRGHHFPQSRAPTFPAEAVVGARQPSGSQAPSGLRKVPPPGLSAAAAIYAARQILTSRQPPLPAAPPSGRDLL